MTTGNNVNTTFPYRSKAVKKLFTDNNHSFITAAFTKFCNMSPDIAFRLLWRLTYYTEDSTNATLTEVLAKLGLNLELISLESISIFRNELRFQYKQMHPHFLDIDVPEGCLNAFTDLLKRTDPIVANMVFEHCESMIAANQNSMEDISFLLGSPKENFYFGGIRRLYFNRFEASYLKPFHVQIHNLFKALYNCYSQMNNEPVVASYEEPVVDPSHEPVQTDSEFKPISPKEIFAHNEAFTAFLSALAVLEKLDFDLKEVIIKRDDIWNLLTSIAALS